MFATTDWDSAPPITAAPAPRCPRRTSAPSLGLACLLAVAFGLVVAAHLAGGWPRLVLAVAACSWSASALARSATPGG
ncbi:MAG TPA: hypothetical protein VFA11_18120 [Acidimicrobiales bacterium]|nr:hypothetical protein [Acidimicrobiales bacterium]